MTAANIAAVVEAIELIEFGRAQEAQQRLDSILQRHAAQQVAA